MLLISATVIFVYFIIWYIVASIIKNAGIIDIGWGFGFVVVAWVGFILNPTLINGFLAAIISLWGLRLTYHIFKRNIGKPEDFRYANFRKQWGKTFYIRSFFQLFMFQAVMMFIIALSFIYGMQNGEVKSLPLAIVGLVIWLIGYIFEIVSDAQLKRFVSNTTNRGKIIQSGLWKISRHPNYFGESVIWWGIFLVSISIGAPWWTIISPITITILLRFVSGVPFLEERMKKKEGYNEYKNKTSIFIPWINKGD